MAACIKAKAPPRRPAASRKRQRAMLTVELIVAMAIVVVAVCPLAISFMQEGRLLRKQYQKAAAMELVDGEMEILLAGEWRAFPEGRQPFKLPGAAATNLPPGEAWLSITGGQVRLEWIPIKTDASSKVTREGNPQ